MKQLFSNRKMNLATLLSGLVSASVLITIVILLVSSYQSEKSILMNTYLSLNYSKATKISHSVDSLFSSMELSLEETAHFLGSKMERSDEEVQEQLELLRNSSRYFNSLTWVDETGLVRSTAPASTGLKGQIITGETRQVLDEKAAILTAPYIGPSGRLLILMSHPVYDKAGAYRGMIGGAIYLQEENVLTEILGNDIIDESGSYYYVTGPDGQILFHPDPARIGVNIISNPVVEKLAAGKSGMEQVVNLKGVSMLSAYSTVPDTGWGVVQQTPSSFVEEQLAVHIQKLIWKVLPPFLLVLVLSVFIARKLAAPFIHLADTVNQMGTGQPVPLPKLQSHWNREADLLTKSVAIAVKAVEKSNDELTQAAMVDPLTGIPNRRKLDEVLKCWTADKRPFSFVLIDIDHFKWINDTYGHQTGDETLRNLAAMLQSVKKTEDMCFRYGGEEFVLLLPGRSAAAAYSQVEKIRLAIENNVRVQKKPVTISIGIAEFPQQAHTSAEAFELADKAMYQSKSAGRNRTTIAL